MNIQEAMKITSEQLENNDMGITDLRTYWRYVSLVSLGNHLESVKSKVYTHETEKLEKFSKISDRYHDLVLCLINDSDTVTTTDILELSFDLREFSAEFFHSPTLSEDDFEFFAS